MKGSEPFEIRESSEQRALEVVAEEPLEDSSYVCNQWIPPVASSQHRKSSTALPMKRDKFVALYAAVLTEGEKKELKSLDLFNDTVYYANDVPSRLSPNEAPSSSDDEDGYYVIKAGAHILYRFEVIKVLGKGSFA